MYCIVRASTALALSTGVGAASEQRVDWKPQFFTADQNEALIAVGERIVPGSAAAACNRLIDSIMTLESDKIQNELLDAVAAFDEQARKAYRNRFRDLEPQQQDAILTSAANDGDVLHSHFSVVKEWIADAYWSSEKGLRELGWTGRVVWENFPGCGQPGAHN